MLLFYAKLTAKAGGATGRPPTGKEKRLAPSLDVKLAAREDRIATRLGENPTSALSGNTYMPRVRDISFIRKLCGSRVATQNAAQCLLPELRKFIPSHSAGVFWVDQHGEMTSLYAERLLPPDAMAAYYQRHYAVKTEGFRMRSGAGHRAPIRSRITRSAALSRTPTTSGTSCGGWMRTTSSMAC